MVPSVHVYMPATLYSEHDQDLACGGAKIPYRLLTLTDVGVTLQSPLPYEWSSG